MRLIQAATLITVLGYLSPVSATSPTDGARPKFKWWHRPRPAPGGKRPNIVVIMTDDQDLRQDSIQYQPTVQRELVNKGLTLQNHFVTVAQCCPSRTSYLRGQAAHNTNVTHVFAPGGAYDKFVAAGQDNNYLPHWLRDAGYNSAYMGKFMNGYTITSYDPMPKGWDFADMLVNPYTYTLNNVVISSNGERPVYYEGYHQSDVMRAIMLQRLEYLTAQDKPFYIQIAPTSPHTEPGGPPTPCTRHMDHYTNLTAPRTPNFNPADEFQSQKPSWIGDLRPLNDTELAYVDRSYRARLQSLLGVDEIVEDALNFLEEKGVLDNTYFIYTSDNGWHDGQHRLIGGKCLPYIEDTNIPMVIRGPGIPVNAVSKVPSTHIDMAPTYLDIAGVAPENLPEFFDGRSLLHEWKAGGVRGNFPDVAREVLNVEYWGFTQEGGDSEFEVYYPENSYKTLRIVGDDTAWLFSRWCTSNETELYNTIEDPYELTNLAISPTEDNAKVISRLNGVLLVTKSCSQGNCRNPWRLLAANADGDFNSLQEALDPRYDAFFDSLPSVGFQTCLGFQLASNEIPYYPPESVSLGGEYRNATDAFVMVVPVNFTMTPGNEEPQGTEAQRHATYADIIARSRVLTDAELGASVDCTPPLYCSGTLLP